MKKFFVLLVALSVMATLVVMPLTVNAAEGDFVVVSREFVVEDDAIKAENGQATMNPRLFWQFTAGQPMPLTLEVKSLTIKKANGEVVDSFNAKNGLNIFESNVAASEDSVTRNEETGILKIEGGWDVADSQLNIWSNGTKAMPAGTYIFEVEVKVTNVDEDYYDMEPAKFDNPCKINVWSNEFSYELMPTDAEPVSIDEWLVGTAAFNGEEPKGEDPKGEDSKGEDPKPTDKPKNEKPTETGDASMVMALLVAGSAAVGGLKSRKK